jgi:hypothetical protein
MLPRGGRDGRTAVAVNGKGGHRLVPMTSGIANPRNVWFEMYIPSMDRRFYLPEM